MLLIVVVVVWLCVCVCVCVCVLFRSSCCISRIFRRAHSVGRHSARGLQTARTSVVFSNSEMIQRLRLKEDLHDELDALGEGVEADAMRETLQLVYQLQEEENER